MKEWNGYVLVDRDYWGRIWYVRLWNPETDEHMSVACEDTEYGSDGFVMGMVDYSIDPGVRREMLGMPRFGGSDELEAEHERRCRIRDFEAGKVLKGFEVEVVKGRKFPIGTRGIVEGFWDFEDRYGRHVARYVVLDDGKRVPYGNVKVVGMGRWA